MQEIRLPAIRYLIFTCLYDLGALRQRLQLGYPLLLDGFELETILTIDDFLGHDPEDSIGRLLFDMEEARAFKRLADVPLGPSSFYGTQEENEAYVRSPEFGAYLDAATECLGLMLAAGRGIPGWDPEPEGQAQ